jgi:hypothetical protein
MVPSFFIARSFRMRSRSAVSWCGSLSTQKGSPVVIKIPEDRWNIDGADLHAVQPRAAKKCSHRLGLADGESAAFVEWDGGGGPIPEPTHHLHLAGVIPHVSGDDAATTRDAPHLVHGLHLIGNEIDDKARNRSIEGALGNR